MVGILVLTCTNGSAVSYIYSRNLQHELHFLHSNVLLKWIWSGSKLSQVMLYNYNTRSTQKSTVRRGRGRGGGGGGGGLPRTRCPMVATGAQWELCGTNVRENIALLRIAARVLFVQHPREQGEWLRQNSITIDSRYIVVIYHAILHSGQVLQWKNFGHTSQEQGAQWSRRGLSESCAARMSVKISHFCELLLACCSSSTLGSRANDYAKTALL